MIAYCNQWSSCNIELFNCNPSGAPLAKPISHNQQILALIRIIYCHDNEMTKIVQLPRFKFEITGAALRTTIWFKVHRLDFCSLCLRLLYFISHSQSLLITQLSPMKIHKKNPMFLNIELLNHVISFKWCGWRDSNSHDFRHHPLKMACLPIPPQPRI